MESLPQVPGEGLEDPGVRSGVDLRLPGPRYGCRGVRHRTRGCDNAGLQALVALVRCRPDRAVLREPGVRRTARCYGGRGAATGQTTSPARQELAAYLPDPPAHHHRSARRNWRRGTGLLVELQGDGFHFRTPTVTVSGGVPEKMGRWLLEDYICSR